MYVHGPFGHEGTWPLVRRGCQTGMPWRRLGVKVKYEGGYRDSLHGFYGIWRGKRASFAGVISCVAAGSQEENHEHLLDAAIQICNCDDSPWCCRCLP